MNIGLVILVLLLICLVGLGLVRGEDTLARAVVRAGEQFAKLGPRLLCALVAAGFIAKLIPSGLVATYLGAEAGFWAVLAAVIAGLAVPAGPVVAFAVAAVLARSDASVPALVAFITSWSLYAAHRIFIYELPLLGPSFLRLSAVSVVIVPFAAGTIALLAGAFLSFAVPGAG
jgi:uncharacterized membrane protein YraQ (UPF0718 family)